METIEPRMVREALKNAFGAVKELSKEHRNNLNYDVKVLLGDIAFNIDQALSIPVRNCDVGTVQDQIERFDKLCGNNSHYDANDDFVCSKECPVAKVLGYRPTSCFEDCRLVWANMPYQ